LQPAGGGRWRVRAPARLDPLPWLRPTDAHTDAEIEQCLALADDTFKS
jgi:hypothetical protein